MIREVVFDPPLEKPHPPVGVAFPILFGPTILNGALPVFLVDTTAFKS